MNEKASGKDDEVDTIPKSVSDLPGIPEGEELSLGPVEGEEIDPLPKWWDETVEADRTKVSNRRLEDGIEPETPRRKKLRPIAAEEPEEEAPAAVASPDPVDAIAEAESVEAAAEPETPPLVGMPEIDLGSIKVKHRPKSEPMPESLQDGDLSVFFADKTEGGGAAESANAVASVDPEPAPEAGPPPIPKKLESPFEDGFETKRDLIPGSRAVAKVEATATTPPIVVLELPLDPELDMGEVVTPAAEAAKEESPKPVEEPLSRRETVPTEEEAVEPETSEPDSVIEAPLSSKELATAPAKKKAGCWTAFATLFFFGTMLVVGLLVVAAIFAWSKMGRLEEEIATLARAKLEERGIHLDYGSWTYEFPRGIVFDEVTVFDDATKERPAMKASGVGVNVDLLALVKDPGSLGSAEFSLSDSTVTLFEKGETFSVITGVTGEIHADAFAIVVERLSAQVGGLRVHLDGVVTLPADEAKTIDAAAATPPVDGTKPSSLPAFDFSGFRALEPWLGIAGAGENAPLLTLSFAMNASEPDLATLEGTLVGTDVAWHGIAFTSLATAFRIDPKTGELRFPNVQVGFGAGLLGASLVVDMTEQKLKIERLQSTVDFIAMLSAFDPAWAETFKAVRFVDAPTVQIVGEMPLGEPVNADLKIRYEHRLGFVHLKGESELPISDIRGFFTYNRGALETNDAALNLFGGQVLVNGATNLSRANRPFTGLVEITGMPLEKASVWFGQDGAGLTGRLFLSFRGTGNSEVGSINGGGNLRVEEAALPNFPVVGPVQSLLGRVVPAFASKASGSVTGAYIIESGVLVTSDLTVRNGGARVVTNGSVNLVKLETSFVSSADLEPALAAATGLQGKAIQVEGSGPLRQPVLKIKQFPVEFAAAGLGEVLGTTPESLATIKEVLGSEDAAEVITGTIEEATGLKIDPAVTDLLKGLLKEEAPAPPTLRAVPQN